MSQQHPPKRLLRPLSSSGDGSLVGDAEASEPNPTPHSHHHPTPTSAATEASAFAEHINAELGEDPHLAHLGMPLDPTDPHALFQACADGIIFCKLINLASPGTVDERAVNVPKQPGQALSFYHKIENNNLAINAARALGCVVTNVGAQDLMEGRSSLVLGLLWQVIKVQLLASVSLRETPELVRLLERDEDIDSLLNLPPEAILLRWINYHLQAAGAGRAVANFGSDLEDGEAYLRLLHHLDPAACPLPSDWPEWAPLERAKHAIKAAGLLGVPSFLQPSDVLRGNRSLNLGFCAHLFNRLPGLEAVTEEDFVGYDFSALELEEAVDGGESREENTLRMWLNSLGLRDAKNEPLFVRSLFGEEMADAVVLLRAMDAIEPGCVPWKRANQPARNRYKQIENANLAIQVAKDMGLVLVNVGGPDLVDRNKKLLLALVGQIMRRYTLGLLRRLGAAGGSEAVSDEEVLAWANAAVSKAEAGGGHAAPCAGFRDPSLADGRFLLALIAVIEPRAVDWTLVTSGEDDLDRLANAKYAVSLARRLGACVFVAPEDIVEVKARAIMLFLAALWACALEREAAAAAAGKAAKRPTATSGGGRAKLVPLAATPSSHGSAAPSNFLSPSPHDRHDGRGAPHSAQEQQQPPLSDRSTASSSSGSGSEGVEAAATATQGCVRER